MTADKKLHLVLNAREFFSTVGAGASALNVISNARDSRYQAAMTVFGPSVENPFTEVRFHPLAPIWMPFSDKHQRLAKAYVRYVRTAQPDLIEVFNSPAMARIIGNTFPHIPMMLRLGNDTRKQLGSRTVEERKWLVERCSEIHCASEFIRSCFLDGLEKVEWKSRVRVLSIGIRRSAEFPEKKPLIGFVGRILEEKGVLPLVEALGIVLPKHPEWKAKLVGARQFKTSEKPSKYELAVAKAAAKCPQIELAGFQPNEQAMQVFKQASIAVVPSIWEEPFSRASAEAVTWGCALVCSDRGGLPENAEGCGFVLEKVSQEHLIDVLEWLISDEPARTRFQHLAWNRGKFDIRARVEEWDSRRDAMLASNR